MVIMLGPGLRGLTWSAGQGHCKTCHDGAGGWGSGGNLSWTRILSRRSNNTPSHFRQQEALAVWAT